VSTTVVSITVSSIMVPSFRKLSTLARTVYSPGATPGATNSMVAAPSQLVKKVARSVPSCQNTSPAASVGSP
jgi:hypothetical protein